MRRILAIAMAACALPIAAAPTAAGAPVTAPPPYVDHVKWAKFGDLSSLRVYPTAAGRDVSGRPGVGAQGDEAWSEVLTLAPDAAIPGMREQFICHWRFAELFEPGKTSWNLEPWRPEVTDQEMVAAGCNPGGTEEPF
ncbi:hypothetical protein NGTWS0302_27540 [Mycolicibacterium cyprinidarum]|uniref:DUF2599 domain-containing protein n=1 Tax=Mycolicibacterium cyprinidarum TaxID=2860311 RepID=A0ABQ4V446_9MYCO|nr:hypothetical protein NGTWS1702_32520 [Mycolicibacterium sp. NGTWSNA01]GJF10946.1 hypothetical protein NGTWS0302_27540 [Mycolicibacterium sp. NGTWS0302]GJF16075.1 hypothetical protein NGTWS1803_01810 [Mycolicibacterium sp. NGTWS1803]